MKTSQVWDNESYEDIERFVQEDLSEYGQDNQCPMSETVILGGGLFRHYELGPIVGFVLWNEWREYNGERHMGLMISQIEEDDEFWYAPKTPTYMSASWMNDMKKTLTRMHKWYHEHFIDGFDKGKWRCEMIKPVEEEKIYGKYEQPGTDVLAVPSND